MKHSKRARTKQLIAAALRRRGYYISVSPPIRSDRAERRSAIINLWFQRHSADEWATLTVVDELKTFTAEDYERIKLKPTVTPRSPFLCFNCDDRGCTLCDDNVRGE